MAKYKLGGCVVLYNPTEEVLANIRTYCSFLDEVVAVDNSTKSSTTLDSIMQSKKTHYISMHGNKGIAAALNVGLSYLAEKGFDYALTMDQDSAFPTEDAEGILRLLDKYSGAYSLIGLNFNYFPENKTDEIVEAPYWLTSGNFVNLADFVKVGGFQSELFIDYVDIEYGHKLYKNKKQLCYLKDYSLKHQIGNPIPIRFLGRTFYAMNHSPLRYYYRYRNSCHLYKADKVFYRKEFVKELTANVAKMLFFEPGKAEKTKMLLRGLRDGWLGRLGPYEEVHSNGE